MRRSPLPHRLQKPAAPAEPVVDEPTRIMTLEKNGSACGGRTHPGDHAGKNPQSRLRWSRPKSQRRSP